MTKCCIQPGKSRGNIGILHNTNFIDSNSHDWNTRLLICACILIITADQGMWNLIIGTTSLNLYLQKEIAKNFHVSYGHQNKPCLFLSREIILFFFFISRETNNTKRNTH